MKLDASWISSQGALPEHAAISSYPWQEPQPDFAPDEVPAQNNLAHWSASRFSSERADGAPLLNASYVSQDVSQKRVGSTPSSSCAKEWSGNFATQILGYAAGSSGKLLRALAGGADAEQVRLEFLQGRAPPFWDSARLKLWSGDFGSEKEAERAGWRRSRKPILAKVEAEPWVLKSEAEARFALCIQEGYMVDGLGVPEYTHQPQRFQRRLGYHFVKAEPATKLLCESVPLPVLAPPWSEPRAMPPATAEVSPAMAGWAHGKHWRELFKENALEENLDPFIKDNRIDYLHGDVECNVDSKCGDDSQHSDDGSTEDDVPELEDSDDDYLSELSENDESDSCAIEDFAGMPLLYNSDEDDECDEARLAESRRREKADAKEGSNLKNAHRPRQAVGKPSGEGRLAFEDYVPTARAILRKGFIFRVLEDETVQVVGEEPLPDEAFSYDVSAYRSLLSDYPGEGWPDKGLDSVFKRGGDDDCDSAPPVCSLSANHGGALEHPGALDAIVDKEMSKGFYAQETSHPPWIPFSVLPMNVVPKDEGWRKIVDASWPKLSSYKSTIDGVPLAPNLHAHAGAAGAFEWCSLAKIAQAVEVYARMLQGSRFEVVGRNSDKSHWFRSTPAAARDCARGVVMRGGNFIKDLRVKMGTANAAQQCARITSLSVSYLERRFDAEVEGFLKKLPADLFNLFMIWDEGRVQVYGPLRAQRRLATFLEYQDDISSIVASMELGALVESLLTEVFEIELRVEMASKGTASIPCAIEFETIGGHLKCSGDDRHCRPRDAVQLKFREFANEVLTLGPGRHRISTKKVLSWVGIFGHMTTAVPGGASLRNSGSMLLRGTKNVPAQYRFVDGAGEFVQAVRKLLKLYDEQHFRPLVRNPKAYHCGLSFCAADACMPDEDSEGGYGIVVGNVYAYGRWPPEIVHAWKMGLLSISPLEYIAGLMALYLLLDSETPEILTRRDKGVWIIARSDNAAACAVSRRHVSTRPVMALCVRAQMEMEEKFQASLLFDHVPGVINRIPDKFSRGDVDEAVAMLKERCGMEPRRVQLGAVWDDWLKRVLGVVATMKKPEGVWEEEVSEFEEKEGLLERHWEKAIGAGLGSLKNG